MDFVDNFFFFCLLHWDLSLSEYAQRHQARSQTIEPEVSPLSHCTASSQRAFQNKQGSHVPWNIIRLFSEGFCMESLAWVRGRLGARLPASVPTCLSGEELSAFLPRDPSPLLQTALQTRVNLQWERPAPTLVSFLQRRCRGTSKAAGEGISIFLKGLTAQVPALGSQSLIHHHNPKVQVEAIEGGALQKLLVILATEQPLTTKKKALFALCSLLRHFPYAQQQFLKLGGLQVLRSLVQEKGMEVLAVRVVTLLYDLVTEKMFAEEDAELTRDMSPERLQQYRQVHLLPSLQEQGWCEITAHLLALPEHDAREKVLQTLGALLATCRDRFHQDTQLHRTLGTLQAEYQALAALELQEGEDEGYFRELLDSINSLLMELR
ncbi:hypothetical protein FD754_006235 [Muntiacus muntjak]|uniref:Nucleotide exchange factor SIL1 n=1 Tax=Muntiacus muntjak TaxID=9888 RepID=A0A5N3WJY0_MUNMU|nr:hypothetical protein FD754_006235 [Muntiacus muntjak]